MPPESDLMLQLTELTSKLDSLLEKQDELVEAMSKVKEAVYNPDDGLYARITALDQKTNARLQALEGWKQTSNKLTWIIVTGLVGLFLTTLWRVIV